MKTCTSCFAEKDESEFYLSSKGRPSSRCKECTKARVRAYYAANVDKRKEYDKNRAMLPHRVSARLAYQATENGREAVSRGHKKYNKSPLKKQAMRRYEERYPSKRLAHIKCGNAIRDGRLIRQPCEACGEAKSQAHHDDYSKPLNVRWLCTKHHAEWHRHNNPIYPEQDAAA